MNKVVVLGSSNMDIVITTNRLPKVGETVIGKEIDYFIGGKGANQAVAAARAKSDVRFLSKVGKDTFGEKILSYLQKEKLDTSCVQEEESIFTGIASIFKLPKDNCITVVSGANDWVDFDYVNKYSKWIKEADVLLVQMEIPIETVGYALQLAKENNVKTIVNPAPYNKEILRFLSYIDYLTPNETELMALLNEQEISEIQWASRMLEWEKKHTTKIILTQGEKGVSFIENEQVVTIPAYAVEVVDTTGAGDTFNGVLAARLSKKEDLRTAILWANAASSLSVTKLGAQTGMPTALEIQEWMNKE